MQFWYCVFQFRTTLQDVDYNVHIYISLMTEYHECFTTSVRVLETVLYPTSPALPAPAGGRALCSGTASRTSRLLCNLWNLKRDCRWSESFAVMFIAGLRQPTVIATLFLHVYLWHRGPCIIWASVCVSVFWTYAYTYCVVIFFMLSSLLWLSVFRFIWLSGMSRRGQPLRRRRLCEECGESARNMRSGRPLSIIG